MASLPPAPDPHTALSILQHGAITLEGVLPYSSNYSFLARARAESQEVRCVYKPREGENPLGDFPYGTLYQRETAAYLVSEALGWNLVPPTLLRDGEYGVGSLQLFIPHDPAVHYFNARFSAHHATALRCLTLFDYVINNADRKSGHCLIDAGQRLWAIDHGICFHTHYKLRTVIWEFAGEPIADDLCQALQHCAHLLRDPTQAITRALHTLLDPQEQQALALRLDHLLQTGLYPSPRRDRRNFPWPPI